MRALRVWHWLAAPSFWEQPLAESNYPFGEILHWTRPMDILWAVNAIPFLHLGNLRDTVFLGGAFLAPWLCVLSAIALAYGLRRQFNVYLTLFGCFIFLSDPVMQNYFFIGRPDHHALMALLGIYAVSLNLCWLKNATTAICACLVFLWHWQHLPRLKASSFISSFCRFSSGCMFSKTFLRFRPSKPPNTSLLP